MVISQTSRNDRLADCGTAATALMTLSLSSGIGARRHAGPSRSGWTTQRVHERADIRCSLGVAIGFAHCQRSLVVEPRRHAVASQRAGAAEAEQVEIDLPR